MKACGFPPLFLTQSINTHCSNISGKHLSLNRSGYRWFHQSTDLERGVSMAVPRLLTRRYYSPAPQSPRMRSVPRSSARSWEHSGWGGPGAQAPGAARGRAGAGGGSAESPAPAAPTPPPLPRTAIRLPSAPGLEGDRAHSPNTAEGAGGEMGAGLRHRKAGKGGGKKYKS